MNSDNTSQIKELVENWCQAIRNKDIANILAHHAEDMVMFDVPLPFQSIGIEAYKKTWDLFFSSAKEPIVFNFTELEITASDTVAFCHGIGHCVDINADGKEEAIEFRLTIGLSKKNGAWVITHEHHSVPAE